MIQAFEKSSVATTKGCKKRTPSGKVLAFQVSNGNKPLWDVCFLGGVGGEESYPACGHPASQGLSPHTPGPGGGGVGRARTALQRAKHPSSEIEAGGGRAMSEMSLGPGPGPRVQPGFLATKDYSEASGFLGSEGWGEWEISWADHQDPWIVAPVHHAIAHLLFRRNLRLARPPSRSMTLRFYDCCLGIK